MQFVDECRLCPSASHPYNRGQRHPYNRAIHTIEPSRQRRQCRQLIFSPSTRAVCAQRLPRQQYRQQLHPSQFHAGLLLTCSRRLDLFQKDEQQAGPAPERRAAQSPKAGPAVKAQNTMVHAPAKEWKTDASRMQHTTQQLLPSRCKSPLSSPQSSQRETLAAPVAAVQKLQSTNAQSNRRGYKNSAEDERGSKESVGKSGGKRFKGNRGKTMESERKRNREESGRSVSYTHLTLPTKA